MTLELLVIQGLLPESQQCMDIGMKRTMTDQLTISRFEHPAVLSTAGKIALAWSTNRFGKQGKRLSDSISDPEIREFIDANPLLVESAEFAAGMKGIISKATVCAVTWRLISLGHDKGRVHEFFTQLAEMQTGGAGDPKYALLNRVNRARRQRERISTTMMLSMVVRTFNADYSGEQVHHLKVATARGGAVAIPAVVAVRSES